MSGFDDIDMPDAGDESDRSSIVSAITPDCDVLRTYAAINPPQLPDFTIIGGQSHETDWHKHSWRYTARKDTNVTGFEVRQLDIDRFDGTEVPDWNNMFYWLPKYNLGPPTNDGDWHGLIAKWGFSMLEKAGFLNYYPPDDDDYMDPLGKLATVRNPDKDGDKRIHPVF